MKWLAFCNGWSRLAKSITRVFCVRYRDLRVRVMCVLVWFGFANDHCSFFNLPSLPLHFVSNNSLCISVVVWIRMAPWAHRFECLVAREWHDYEVWPCWRKYVTRWGLWCFKSPSQSQWLSLSSCCQTVNDYGDFWNEGTDAYHYSFAPHSQSSEQEWTFLWAMGSVSLLSRWSSPLVVSASMREGTLAVEEAVKMWSWEELCCQLPKFLKIPLKQKASAIKHDVALMSSLLLVSDVWYET